MFHTSLYYIIFKLVFFIQLQPKYLYSHTHIKLHLQYCNLRQLFRFSNYFKIGRFSTKTFQKTNRGTILGTPCSFVCHQIGTIAGAEVYR